MCELFHVLQAKDAVIPSVKKFKKTYEREWDSAPIKKAVHTTTKPETKTKVKETDSTVIT